MKKFFFMAATVSVALTSCVKNEIEVPQTGEDKAIAFAAPVVGSNTRAVNEIGTNYPTTSSFNVWAYYYGDGGYSSFNNGKLHINEATAEYNNTENTWYPKNDGNYYYWPKNGSLTFIAYSPATDYIKNQASVDGSGITINNYIVYSNVAQQVDLLYSERQYNETTSSVINTPYKGTDLTFNHALSSIVFNVKLDKQYPEMTVKLKGIKFTNVANKATFKQNLDDATGKLTKTPAALANDPTSPNLSTNVATWTIADDAQRIEYAVDDASYTLDNNTTPAAYWPCTQSETAPAESGNLKATDLILIPQQHTVGGNEIGLTIDYSIKSSDGDEIDQVYTTELGSGEWKMGYRYKYNVTFGFDPITLAPTVSVWQDAVAIDKVI